MVLGCFASVGIIADIVSLFAVNKIFWCIWKVVMVKCGGVLVGMVLAWQQR
jgi:hypothetical protein